MISDDGARLERRIRVNALYDLYRPLLTERQRNVYEMRYFQDFAFVEIAEALNVTRQAIHILTNRTVERLLKLEKDLGFAAKLECLEKKVENLEALLAGSGEKSQREM